MSAEAVAVLERARELISDPERWTQRAFARNSVGEATSASGPGATCWCALGAIAREEGRSGSGAVRQLREGAGLHGTGTYLGIADFNDVSTHAEVLAAFDKAIALGRGDRA